MTYRMGGKGVGSGRHVWNLVFNRCQLQQQIPKLCYKETNHKAHDNW